MKIHQKKKNSNNKKIIILVLILLLAALLGAFAYYRYKLSNKSQSATTTSTISSTGSKTSNEDSESAKNTSESTTADNKASTAYSTANKTKTNSDPQAATSTNSSTGKTVVSVVTSANISNGVVYIRGGVNNLVSTNASCYASLKSPSGSTLTKQTTLLRSASTTDCKTIQIPVSELSKGTWTYTLHYSSSDTEGASSENSFTID